MSWALELFQTVDGLRLGSLPVVPFSWDVSVREAKMDGPPTGAGAASTGQMRFSLSMLEDAGWIDRDQPDWQGRLLYALMPKRHGIMALYDGVPIVGGPIGDTVRITSDTVEVTVDGYDEILRHRYVVPEEFAANRQIHYSGYSLGTIAGQIVQHVMEKPAGRLPIHVRAGEFARRQRTYQAFNVANLAAADLHEKLANVINGPDITLRPYVRSQQSFGWQLLTGTEADPWIGQETVHDWEQGSPDVVDLEADLSTAFVAHRVYGVGDGEDIGTRVTRVDAEVPPGWPLIEQVVTDSQITTDERLRDTAAALLNPYPVLQIRARVRADGSTPLGTFWPGEVARFTVRDFPAIPDGTYDLRILSMSGDAGAEVELVFDPVVVDRW